MKQPDTATTEELNMQPPDSQTEKHYDGDPTKDCGFMCGGVECRFGYGHDGPHSWDPRTWGPGSAEPAKKDPRP